MSTTYRFAVPLLLRLLGVWLVLCGVVMLLVVGAALLTGGIADGWLFVPVVLVLVGLAGLLVLRRTPVLVLDDAGYRVRLVRGAGTDRAGWREVEDAVAATVDGQRCVLLRLRDGRTTTLPVDLLGVDPERFVRVLQEHLTAGHGYRRLG